MQDNETQIDIAPSSRGIVNETVLKEVLKESSRVVEVRIAQFRVALALLLLVFSFQLHTEHTHHQDWNFRMASVVVSIAGLPPKIRST